MRSAKRNALTRLTAFGGLAVVIDHRFVARSRGPFIGTRATATKRDGNEENNGRNCDEARRIAVDIVKLPELLAGRSK
jgi:hypothetical protein